MSSEDTLKDCKLLIRSRYGVIHLNSDEEHRSSVLLRHLADQLYLPYFDWSSTKGLRKNGNKDSVYGSENPSSALHHIEHTNYPAVYHFHGLGDYLEDKNVIARLKDVAKACSKTDGVVVITGTSFEIPSSLQALMAVVKMPEATIHEYKDLLKHILRDISSRARVKIELNNDDLTRLLNNLKGLSMMEAEKLLTRIIVEDHKITAKDIRKVMEAKKGIVEKEGLLEYYPVEESMEDIADLKGLKDWLKKRKEIIVNPDKAKQFGLTFPKGVLLLGVQGCGKSLCAKAIAMGWGLPLLKLDPSQMYNKYIGETEKNFNRAMKTSERLAPVILWIDEIEKAFSSSGGSEDGGVSTRVLGTFLTWMQEKKGDVFVIATANNIDRLPPEFLRKGRFDEIFFVDLPQDEARQAIFEIHLKKRERDPKGFDLKKLVEASNGFSGAEIEQAVVSGLYTAFSHNQKLNTDLLVKEIKQTRPLSKTMAEKVQKLRDWAKTRTVSAH